MGTWNLGIWVKRRIMKGHAEKEIRKVGREGELGAMEFKKGNVTVRGARVTGFDRAVGSRRVRM